MGLQFTVVAVVERYSTPQLITIFSLSVMLGFASANVVKEELKDFPLSNAGDICAIGFILLCLSLLNCVKVLRCICLIWTLRTLGTMLLGRCSLWDYSVRTFVMHTQKSNAVH